ncbi:hypothetical protein [Cognatishimia sp. F0-27]|uniref:hypothetical protein n=1 Tax=Cognatishimia sp. F0-27 TaxID=2816855 RepID=UPI001D0C5A60|nr:hypothetical protein [Cognatishimia sp. F0-27]MCC1491061.1 hypothetical protein [Cognatishimia sp. F0-27]
MRMMIMGAMRLTPGVLALMALVGQVLPAAADEACEARIRAMFDGGPLDPFVRPAHEYTNTVSAADGTEKYRFLVRMVSPVQSVAGIVGQGPFSMVIGSDSWTGPSIDGPWTAANNALPEDHMAHQRSLHEQQTANLERMSCEGMVDLDDAPHDVVRFFTKTDPNPDMGDAWFGSDHRVFIDPETNRVMRWEMTQFVNSFSDGVSDDRHVLVYRYDDAIRIERP